MRGTSGRREHPDDGELWLLFHTSRARHQEVRISQQEAAKALVAIAAAPFDGEIEVLQVQGVDRHQKAWNDTCMNTPRRGAS